MNHKRRGPKSTRAGCLMCKPHKDQRRKDGWDAQPMQERRARLAHREQLAGAPDDGAGR